MRSRYGLTTVAVILTSAVTLTAPALAAPGQSGAHAPLYYVALGDSLSVGVQPDATGMNRASDEGYPDQLHALLRTTMPHLRLVKLGCSGETTLTMIRGGVCRYPKGSQLGEALAFLHAHRQFVTLVTLDVGADDLLPCASDNAIDPACVSAAFGTVPAHLFRILTALREAAGPDVPIVAMNYYNPFVAAWLQGPDGQALALGSAAALAQFNAVLGGIYDMFSVSIADVASAFDSADFTTPVVVPGLGVVPRNVALVCAWTWMCVFPPQGPNHHPNAVGYGVITEAILQVLP